ncbi:virion protein [Cetacean poxvirus 1]|nr:virion protein [Cetacean poxvirus 1]
MDLELQKKANAICNSNVLFFSDVQYLKQEDNYIVLERNSVGTPIKCHVYEQLARFDNLTIFQIIKYVYSKKPNTLRLLFPSKSILDSIIPLKPIRTISLSSNTEINDEYKDDSDICVKLALMDIFNAFKINKKKATPYYYLPFSKDINYIVS